jgi:hypothetical protein
MSAIIDFLLKIWQVSPQSLLNTSLTKKSIAEVTAEITAAAELQPKSCL